MRTYSLAEIAEITGGALTSVATGAETVSGAAEFDSRRVSPGCLFVALPGAHVDGHDFVEQSIQAGSSGALVAREVDAPAVIVSVDESSASDISNAYAFAADDTGQAKAVVKGLSALARHNVDVMCHESGMQVIAVTGSAGKTSTKDFLATVCGSVAPTVAPPGSFNNEIGLPYTALKCDETTKYLISEMSARGVGHIRHLTNITPPHIGIVLNVGHAHLGEFGSQDAIAQGKGELVEAVPSTGVAVLNWDDPRVAAMKSRTQAQIVWFSTDADRVEQQREEDADDRRYPVVYARNIQLDERAYPTFTLVMPNGTAPVQLRVSGLHQVSNAVAAAAAGSVLGMTVEQIAKALSEHTAASAHRMDVQERGDGLVIINDAYNANPDSMRAAIAALEATAAKHFGESWAVLGQMAELGDETQAAHEALADTLAQHHIAHLVTVGCDIHVHALAERAAELGIDTHTSENRDGALNVVARAVSSGDTVLIKASNSEGLWRLAEELMAIGG